MTFLDDLRSKSACSEGFAWAKANGITSVAEAWAKLTRSDWMFWLAEQFSLPLDEPSLRQFTFECADRAVHIHAVAALRSAGLADTADRLAALPQIVDAETAEVAREAAWDARSEIHQRHSAADWDTTWALWSAVQDVADAAAWDDAWAARGAAWDAVVDAAWAAADNKDIERLWQADRLRELFPEVTVAKETPHD